MFGIALAENADHTSGRKKKQNLHHGFVSMNWFKPLLLVCLGGLLGVGLSIAALYKTSFVNRLDSVKQRLGMTSYWSGFGYGHDLDMKIEWPGVTSPTNPIWKVRPGYDVELVSSGFTYPVNIVFIENPGDDPDSPIFYVNEMHGAIKYMGKDGKVHVFADNLINFEPFPIEKSDERGLSGLATIPDSDDLLVTTSYLNEKAGLLSNKILRLQTTDGGKTMSEAKELLDLKEFTSPSNQIQQILVGPDGYIYCSVGDAENHEFSLDKSRFGGKILRMNLDGTACEENPFYNPAAPDSPTSYLYAYGFRNVFDFDFLPSQEGGPYAVDNGKNIDRFSRVAPGGCYGWNGDVESIRTNSLYTWGPIDNTAPVGMTFMKGVGLGEDTIFHCFIAYYGPAGREGANHGKAIVEFTMDHKTGLIQAGPETIVQYQGEKKTTVLGLAEGPDGLYFTDFFGESTDVDATGTGNIWKVVTSDATSELPTTNGETLAKLKPEQRGQVYFRKNCSTCHRLDGWGGREGPELTLAHKKLPERLQSKGYVAALNEMIAKDMGALEQEQWRLQEVAGAPSDDKYRVWLKHHLEEPRFDNPFAKMPNFKKLPEEQRNDIISFLMSRN